MSEDDLWKVSSFAGTFTLVEHAIQVIAENPFNDGELEALGQYSKDRRMKLVARLMDLVEGLRESLRDLDAVVIAQASGLHEVKTS
jgi:hypothetical protein